MTGHTRALRHRLLATLGLLALIGVNGCLKPQIRSQNADEFENRYPIKTVGDATTVGNADPIPVGGIGLVIGLNGTGCNPQKGNARDILEHALKKGKNRDLNVKKLLASPDTAMVIVSGVVPAGSSKGDKIDLEVRLPAGSRATSLKGGTLYRCTLRTHERAGNLSRRFQGSDATIMGSPVVVAGGPIEVGLGEGDESERMKQGRVWKGGNCLVHRPFHLYLTQDNQFARISSLIADRVNSTFRTQIDSDSNDLAVAKDNRIVMLAVPPRYQRNLRRYLRIVRMVPLSEDYEGDEDNAPRRNYREQLRHDILDPAHTVLAAMRLEALGEASIPVLKQGLENKDPLVQFSAAQSLAYLGNTAGVDHLVSMIKDQPYLRGYSLTALASLDESVCRIRLRDLLMSDLDDETRYGAFRALKAVDDRDPLLGMTRLENFSIHRVSPKTKKPMLHVSLGKKPELVFFGDSPELAPPFALLAGEYTITAAENDQRCTVSYFPRDAQGTSRLRCSLDLTEIVAAMTQQGASYPEIVEMLRQAEKTKSVVGRVRYDALPQSISVYELAEAGRQRKQLLEMPDGPEKMAMFADMHIIKPIKSDKLSPKFLDENPATRIAKNPDARKLLEKKEKSESRTAFLK